MARWHISASSDTALPIAPGVYVRLDDPHSHAFWLPQRPQIGLTRDEELDFTGLGKIAALGIKVSRHSTYHGLALNVNMNLEPYTRINPYRGYAGLRTVDLSTMGVTTTCDEAAQVLTQHLQRRLAPESRAVMSTPEVGTRSAIGRSLQPAGQAEGCGQLLPHSHQGRTGRSPEEARVDSREGR